MITRLQLAAMLALIAAFAWNLPASTIVDSWVGHGRHGGMSNWNVAPDATVDPDHAAALHNTVDARGTPGALGTSDIEAVMLPLHDLTAGLAQTSDSANSHVAQHSVPAGESHSSTLLANLDMLSNSATAELLASASSFSALTMALHRTPADSSHDTLPHSSLPTAGAEFNPVSDTPVEVTSTFGGIEENSSHFVSDHPLGDVHTIGNVPTLGGLHDTPGDPLQTPEPAAMLMVVVGVILMLGAKSSARWLRNR